MSVALLQGIVLLLATLLWGEAVWGLLSRDVRIAPAADALGRAAALGLFPAVAVRALTHARLMLGEPEGGWEEALLAYASHTPQGRAAILMSIPAMLLPMIRAVLPWGPRRHVAILVPLGVLALAQASQGHARILERVALGAAVDALHLVAALTWVGGLVALGLASLEAAPRPDALRRFSYLALACVAALLASAAGTWALHFGPRAEPLGTAWGAALGVKTATFAAMAVLGARHRRRVRAGGAPEAASILLESGIGLLAVLVASLLTQLDPHARDVP